MDVDILVEDSRWNSLGLDTLAQDAFSACLAHLGLASEAAEISLLACDDARIATLNAEFRGKPLPTNVLSWPAQALAADVAGASPSAPRADWDDSLTLGDIAIAFDTCAREAAALDKPVAHHVTHLLVHGLLHLLGYDHIRDPDAALMQRIEIEVLGKMGLDDPYRT